MRPSLVDGGGPDASRPGHEHAGGPGRGGLDQVREPDGRLNEGRRDALAPARKHAYDLAYDGGVREQFESGSKKPDVRIGGCSAKVNQQVGNSNSTGTMTDPTVLNAAQAYGSCLQQRGYTVPSTKPGVIERTLEQLVQQEHTDSPVADKKQGLSKEIKTSLDDLECGKAYEEAAKPFVEKLLQSGSADDAEPGHATKAGLVSSPAPDFRAGARDKSRLSPCFHTWSSSTIPAENREAGR